MDETPKTGIIFSWTIDGTGGGQRVSHSEISEEIRNAGLAWVHVNDTKRSARKWIEREFSYLDRIILDALLADETHPRYLDHQDGILLILRGVNLNPDEKPEDMISLRIWIDSHRIITVEHEQIRTIRDIDHALANGNGPTCAGDFLTMLTEHLFEYMSSAITRIHDRLDDLEDGMSNSPELVESNTVTELRRVAMKFHRYVSPQRDVIAHLANAKNNWLNDTHRRDFLEDWDKVKHILEDLDFLRDRARIVSEELNSLTNQKTNRNLYILSGIATIFMPLTFITGLLGMNVEGIPGADHPEAFAIVTVVTVVFGILLPFIFKKLKRL